MSYRYKIIRRPVKNPRIELVDGEIIVIAPRGVDVDKLIAGKKEWIERNLKKINEAREKAKREIKKKGVRILDKYYKIKRDCNNVGISGAYVHVCKKDSNSLRKDLRELLREDMSKRVLRFSSKLNVKYEKIFIREQKTKWGTCSSKKNISFNLGLIFLPEWYRDYVAAHEVAHLLHMNHGREFKATLKKLKVRIPNRKEQLYAWYYAQESKERLKL